MHDDRLLWLLLLVPLVMSLVGVWTLDHAKTNKPLFSITNLIGPTAQSLLAGDGLVVCTEDMGTRGNPICGMPQNPRPPCRSPSRPPSATTWARFN